MSKIMLREELVSKIKIFNQIFELDFFNDDGLRKSWKSYLDPISKYLFNKSYISFVNDNPLEANNPPGSLEAYYNMMSYVVKDLEKMTSLKIPNEIYCAASDIKKTFDEFLSLNQFKVSKIIDKEEFSNKVVYRIYPTI